MHYANGRPAKAGDAVINLQATGPYIQVGIIHSLNPNAQSCNGMIRLNNAPSDYSVNVNQCLHVEDVQKAMKTIPDSTAPKVVSEPQSVNA